MNVLNKWLSLGASLVLAGCASAPLQQVPSAAVPSQPQIALASEDNLNATLWTQGSAEFRASAIQAWHQAYPALERMLEARHLSAAAEQLGPFSELPPAIIVDVDETVLDNSSYIARLVSNAAEFDDVSWSAWCKEEAARPIPGARAFLLAAAAKGVTVFYVTNRRVDVREATRNNLVNKGFPMKPGVETVLTLDESVGWTSSKGTRRAFIAKNYRVVLVAGDNLGDFIDTTRGSPADRFKVIRPYRQWWGERWIMLPNPMYGSWEDAVLGFERGLAPDVKRERKLKALRLD